MRMSVYFHLSDVLVVFKLCNRARAWKEVKKFIIWKLFKREDRQRASLEAYCIRRDPSLWLIFSKFFHFFSGERYRVARVRSPLRERRRAQKSEKKVVFSKVCTIAKTGKQRQKKNKKKEENTRSSRASKTVRVFPFFRRDFVLVCGFLCSLFP